MNAESYTPALELREVTKTFPGTRALNRVSFEVRAGEVVALLGENGAGKSTLMKVLSGVWPAGTFEGEILVQGKSMSFKDTRDAHAAGIAMIHQELSVFPELSVAEHLELDHLPRWIRWNSLHARTQKFLDLTGLGLRSTTRVGDLSVGGRQLVEIARALYRDAKVIVFDEPTSALTEQEVVKLYQIIERLRAEGRAIIYITHRMDEVFRLADRMVVLRDGQYVGETDAHDDSGAKVPRGQLEPQLIRMMVGREIQDVYPAKNPQFGEELLSVRGLSLVSPRGKVLVRDLSFQLRRGEVLGLGGLLGAGRSETFEAIFGVLNGAGPRTPGYKMTGSISVLGRKLDPLGRPIDAIRSKMAYVSEDRKGSGLVLGQSILDNLMLPALASGRSGVTHGRGMLAAVNQAETRAQSVHWSKQLRVKSANLDQAVRELSGGNQQKVVLAKWLMTEPDILFLDEPTRGIDVGAKVEIYHWIRKLSEQGIGIVLASSEMPELLGLCHRLLVLREGQVSAELPGSTTQEEIMKAASL